MEHVTRIPNPLVYKRAFIGSGNNGPLANRPTSFSTENKLADLNLCLGGICAIYMRALYQMAETLLNIFRENKVSAIPP